mmetsp:Transcript_62473/g.116073  ORF Transcript_62473/g.116073 Transcript_62473/m.116073 type:complete len:214 (+) Transcript_62473:99-740(+)
MMSLTSPMSNAIADFTNAILTACSLVSRSPTRTSGRRSQPISPAKSPPLRLDVHSETARHFFVKISSAAEAPAADDLAASSSSRMSNSPASASATERWMAFRRTGSRGALQPACLSNICRHLTRSLEPSAVLVLARLAGRVSSSTSAEDVHCNWRQAAALEARLPPLEESMPRSNAAQPARDLPRVACAAAVRAASSLYTLLPSVPSDKPAPV